MYDQQYGALKLIIPERIIVCQYSNLLESHPELVNLYGGHLLTSINKFVHEKKKEIENNTNGNSTTFIPSTFILGQNEDDRYNIEYSIAYGNDGTLILSLGRTTVRTNIAFLEEAMPGIADLENGKLIKIALII